MPSIERHNTTAPHLRELTDRFSNVVDSARPAIETVCQRALDQTKRDYNNLMEHACSIKSWQHSLGGRCMTIPIAFLLSGLSHLTVGTFRKIQYRDTVGMAENKVHTMLQPLVTAATVADKAGGIIGEGSSAEASVDELTTFLLDFSQSDPKLIRALLDIATYTSKDSETRAHRTMDQGGSISSLALAPLKRAVFQKSCQSVLAQGLSDASRFPSNEDIKDRVLAYAQTLGIAMEPDESEALATQFEEKLRAACLDPEKADPDLQRAALSIRAEYDSALEALESTIAAERRSVRDDFVALADALIEPTSNHRLARMADPEGCTLTALNDALTASREGLDSVRAEHRALLSEKIQVAARARDDLAMQLDTESLPQPFSGSDPSDAANTLSAQMSARALIPFHYALTMAILETNQGDVHTMNSSRKVVTEHFLTSLLRETLSREEGEQFKRSLARDLGISQKRLHEVWSAPFTTVYSHLRALAYQGEL